MAKTPRLPGYQAASFRRCSRKPPAARCVLRKVLAAENPDVTVARRGGAAAP